MENEILYKIYHLYRSHIVTLIIFTLLCCVAVSISIGVIKFGLIKSKVNRVLLLSIVCLCSVLLLVAQIIQLVPVRLDYKESSYIILKDATMTVTTESSGGLDRINQVVVVDNDGKLYDLKLQSNYLFDSGNSYTGTIVYLKYSSFVIWYDIDL